jgi:anti-sigma factor RsiW
MANRSVFADRQLQDYVDGRLSERDRAAVAAFLLAHPHVAAEVEAVRRQSDALRALGHEILDEPVPERLRALLRDPKTCSRAQARPMTARAQPRRAPRLLATAGALLLLCVGGALGWFAQGALRPAPTPADALLAHMADAYALYGTGDYPGLFPPERANEFVTWIGRSFEREVPPPNLAELGYRYRGGRLLPNADAHIGLFHFEHPHNARLAVFFWTNAGTVSVLPSLPERNGLAARFWTTDGLSFAVIGDKTDRDLETAADSVFKFYEQALHAR